MCLSLVYITNSLGLLFQMNNSGQLNSLKFGDKVIKADYSSESDRVTRFF